VFLAVTLVILVQKTLLNRVLNTRIFPEVCKVHIKEKNRNKTKQNKNPEITFCFAADFFLLWYYKSVF
jgi:hypothetical protein